MASMGKRQPNVLTGNPASHAAFHAWTRLTGDPSPPSRIDSFQSEKAVRKASLPLVFRLYDVAGSRSIIAKRSSRNRLEIELQIYRDVLPHLPITSVRCLGTIDAMTSPEHVWAFFDDAGDAPWLVSDSEHRLLAARWMGALHAASQRMTEASRLPERGVGHYRQHAESAASRLQEANDSAEIADDVRREVTEILQMIDAILRQWGELEAIAEAPRALLHGDFVKKNVRVLRVDDTQQLLAIDWEFAGLGTPAADIYEAHLAFDADAGDEYRNAAARFGWSVSVDDLRRLSAAGALFRAISGIYWETLVLGSGFRDRFDWRISAHRERLQNGTSALAGLSGFSQS